MNIAAALRLTLLALLSLSLAACGFALRGSTATAGGSQGQLVAAEPASAMAVALRDALQSAGMIATTSSDWQLQLGPETLISRPGSVNSRARAAASRRTSPSMRGSLPTRS